MTQKTQFALVTGASRGIGRAIAQKLASDGLFVWVHYGRGADQAAQVVAEIQASGGTARAIGFDVVDAAGTNAALETILSEGPIQVLVNNAGITRDVPMPGMSYEDWTTVTRTTLDGFFNVTQRLLMPMIRSKWGRIINIASVSGVTGNRGQVNYSAAKAGLIGASKALAQELAKRKITVNVVAPGPIETDMWTQALEQGTPEAEVLKRIPMQRIGQPAEVASMVAYLAREEASYVTGQVIGVNGGMA